MLATKFDGFETEFVGWIGKNVLTLHHASHAEGAGGQRSLGDFILILKTKSEL